MRRRADFTIGHATRPLTEVIFMLTSHSQSCGIALIDW